MEYFNEEQGDGFFTGSPSNPNKIYEIRSEKLRSLEPHIFSVAEAAYSTLLLTGDNQTCVMMGESGSGKTESARCIVQYLCSTNYADSTWIDQQILEADTILEAFGNAKSSTNANSSRFGKFMQISFDHNHHINGCVVHDYLLEQSRVAFQSTEEFNFHVFYYLIAGAQYCGEISSQFMVGTTDMYHYLDNVNSSISTADLEIYSYVKKFDDLRLALNMLSVPQRMSDGLFSTLSAILWIGNLCFAESADGTKCTLNHKDKKVLNRICKLLGLPMLSLEHALTHHHVIIGKKEVDVGFKLHEARENRHCIAKVLYMRVFAWLVEHINVYTNPDNDVEQFIGLLDLGGFEEMWVNGFEQFCFNLANERLHQYFNDVVFVLEQAEYRNEELDFSFVDFCSNSSTVELLERPDLSILSILDEETKSSLVSMDYDLLGFCKQ
ncbi:myosin-I heavy chain-like [Tubulanus polymorphus]|uniref:myosin-I heavy chain-like n=1 Tax=Tubulanus polymorphus TaxID=672921 RepID=UPI003DA1FEB8